jgi:tRNA pseudouridine38-40 synthase
MIARMRFAVRLAYDGTDYHGWWRQPGCASIGAELDAAFTRFGETLAQPVAASRTDAGVHARGQVAHVDVQRVYAPERLLAHLAMHLPANIACTAIAAAPDDFDAVLHAQEKHYCYRIHNSLIPNPFTQRFVWHPPFRLNLSELNALAKNIPGTRDWSGFAKRGETRHLDGDLIRSIFSVHWEEHDDELRCHVRGGGFTYRLVRSLIGAQIAVAHGTCSPAQWFAALSGEINAIAAQQAPACGLCLQDVRYAHSLSWVTSTASAAQVRLV